MKTIIDIETWTPNVLSNTTGGISPGQMFVFTAGRQTGKSWFTQQMLDKMYSTNLCKEIVLPMFPTKPKYKFSRKKWYEGKFNWKQYDEVRDWCEQNFGKHDKKPDAWSRWNHMYEDMILFRDEKDYMLFVLRWS